MEGGVSEQVAEVLKELQQLVRGVLEDGQHLRGHHVVDDKEGRLRERTEARGNQEELLLTAACCCFYIMFH